MNYYQFIRKERLRKAQEKYSNKSGKKAAGYYLKNKEKI